MEGGKLGGISTLFEEHVGSSVQAGHGFRTSTDVWVPELGEGPLAFLDDFFCELHFWRKAQDDTRVDGDGLTRARGARGGSAHPHASKPAFQNASKLLDDGA